jgi:hypothetical protein
MELNDYTYLKGLDQHQQMLFINEMNNRAKSKGWSFALAFIFGPWANRLYLGEYGLAVAFLILQVVLILAFVLVIPPILFAVWWVWELCQISGKLASYNDRVRLEVLSMIRGQASPGRPQEAR